MREEIWKDIVGYEGLYQISSKGRVKRLARVGIDSMGRNIPYKEKILVNYISKRTGYPCVNLSKNRKTSTLNIHKLIADAFIPNPNNLPCINHIDENRTNSTLENLERCSYSYNNSYGNANAKRKTTLRAGLEGKHKTIYQYTTTGDIVNVYNCGVNQLEEKLGYEIQDCLTGKSKTANGFVFSYSDIFYYEENKPKSHQKYVIKIDKDGKEIERYKSVSIAGEANGFDRHLFSRTAPIDGIITIKGMRFIVEKKENEYIPVGRKGPRPDLKGKGAKAVCQYTKKGEFVAEYTSLKDAAIGIGNAKCAPEISNCCRGKLKTVKGYVWRYKNDDAPQPLENEKVRSISQYTFNGEFVRTYPSISDAIAALGKGTPTCISNNLTGRSHSAYGYVWKYLNT